MNVQPDPADAAMEACLTCLGFSAADAKVVKQQGVTNATQFKLILYQAMGQLTDSIVRAAAQNPYAGNVQAQRQGTIVLYTELRDLKALRAWLEFRIVRKEDLDVDLFNGAVRDRWLLCINGLDNLQQHPPATTFNLLTSPANDKSRLSFTIINTSLTGEVSQALTYQKVYKTDKNNWYGNFWLTSVIAFFLHSEIQKHKRFMGTIR
jgi:hypothetical protein